MPDSQLHALTIDVEDWFHVCKPGGDTHVPQSAWRVRIATERILEVLVAARCKATFFMLGSVAAAEPELAVQIVEQGHEIASHGWSHRMLHEIGAEGFEDELARTEDVLIRQTGCRPRGFRAPRWSLSEQTPWAYEILARRGYFYDSSRNPLPFLGGSASGRYPEMVHTGHGPLWEVPPMVTPTLFFNLPTGGGWGFRFFGERMISDTIQQYARDAQPAVLYLHPRELDPHGPRLALPPLRYFTTYGSRRDAAPRVAALLTRFRFTTLAEMVTSWPSAS